MSLVRIGTVVRAVGLAGHVGVAGTDGALATLETVVLRRAGGEEERRRVVEARPQGKSWAVRLEEVTDRTGAEGLVGCEVLAERDDLGEAGEGLHYWGDLEGLEVVTEQGAVVGRVTGLLATGAVDVLEVKDARGREVLIPLAPYVRVEQGAGRVVVDPPEGLLELGSQRGEEEEGGPPRGG